MLGCSVAMHVALHLAVDAQALGEPQFALRSRCPAPIRLGSAGCFFLPNMDDSSDLADCRDSELERSASALTTPLPVHHLDLDTILPRPAAADRPFLRRAGIASTAEAGPPPGRRIIHGLPSSVPAKRHLVAAVELGRVLARLHHQQLTAHLAAAPSPRPAGRGSPRPRRRWRASASRRSRGRRLAAPGSRPRSA